MGGDQSRMDGESGSSLIVLVHIQSHILTLLQGKREVIKEFSRLHIISTFKKSLSLFYRKEIERKQELDARGLVRRSTQGSR